MTNEDAFTRIKATESCFVVWSPALNEVVTVTPCKAGNQAPDVVLEAMTAGDGPKVGRFFISATVTMNTLRDQQTEIARTAQRVRILHTLPAWDTEQLIVPLETGVFPATFSARDDGELLIRELYYARVNQLSPQQLARLDALAAETSSSALGSNTRCNLECALAVMRADRSRLEHLWEPRIARNGHAQWSNLITAVGDLALHRDDIIATLVRMVETAWPFQIRFESMLALGKIGAPAGEPAAASIATHIYDSSEEVSAVRDQVLSRIRTPRSAWKPCGVCVRGMVRRVGHWNFTECSQCLGIGHVPVAAASL